MNNWIWAIIIIVVIGGAWWLMSKKKGPGNPAAPQGPSTPGM